jgi:hypothetical protein
MPIDFESNLKDLKNYQQHVLLAPDRWRRFAPAAPLHWSNVKFEAGNRGAVPENRGIYAFVVQFQDHGQLPIPLPPHGYVMYAGVTGEVAAGRTLRDRYGDYLREQRRSKRRSIWLMLNKWKEDIYFHYAPVDAAFDLGAAEEALNDAMIPPYVTQDFSAEVRELVRALKAN